MSYFKIESNETFTEWKKMTTVWEKVDYQAKILPDRNYIQDMLTNFELYWDEITETDYHAFLKSLPQ